MGRVLYLELVGGAAGDMILAALIDAGASIERVRGEVGALGLAGVEVRAGVRYPAGMRALGVDVMVRGELADQGHEHVHAHDHGHVHAHGHDHDQDHGHGHGHGETHTGHAHAHAHAPPPVHRPARDVLSRLASAPLSDRVRAIASAAFRRLAEVEAAIHGVSAEEVELHEVGSDDAIADIVGVSAAIADLAPDEIVVSPVPIGRGLGRSAHGAIPFPAPATIELLKGAPLEQTDLRGETVTPTGAALLATLADRYGPVPSMVLERVGTGAGHRAWPDRPNIVRAWIGTSREPRRRLYSTDTECVLEANLDDMSPAHLAALERALFAAGAADVWSAPIQMKKGRHGVLVSALATRSSLDAIAETFLLHSTTLGIRVTDVARLRGERRLIEVETEFGKVRVKIAERPKGPPLVMPEFEDCDRLAQAGGTSVRAVFEAAQRAAWARRDPGDPSS